VTLAGGQERLGIAGQALRIGGLAVRYGIDVSS
jgi:hypothetical protein